MSKAFIIDESPTKRPEKIWGTVGTNFFRNAQKSGEIVLLNKSHDAVMMRSG
jgi:hypothetical protein